MEANLRNRRGGTLMRRKWKQHKSAQTPNVPTRHAYSKIATYEW